MDLERVVLPSLALALGVATSIYFFIWWWRHRNLPASRHGGEHARPLLFWAIALFLFYWFQVPIILGGFGKVITVTDFNLFFALTFPITFLALILIYLGILQIAEIRLGTKRKILLFAWFALAVAFFAYYFITRKGIIEDYALPLVGNIVFYPTIRILIAFTAARLLSRPELRNTYGILGAAGIIGESILGLMRNLFVIKTVLAYSPQFWYMAMSNSRFFFVTQTISVTLLVIGFYFFHRAYHRHRYDDGQASRRR